MGNEKRVFFRGILYFDNENLSELIILETAGWQQVKASRAYPVSYGLFH